MRSISFSVLFVFAAIIMIGPAYAIDPNKAVAIWLFDEGEGAVAGDSSGNGHDGEIVGPVEWVNGKFGSALEFGASDGQDFVKIPHDDGLTLENYSIVVWVNIPAVSGNWQGILAKDGWPDRNYGIWVFNNSGKIHHSFKAFGGGDNQTVNSTTEIADGQWHHIAATYDMQASTIYIDGVLEGSNEYTDQPAVTDVPVAIGGGPANSPGGHKLFGSIDDAAIFSVALSADEIKDIMNEGIAGALNLTAVELADKLPTTWAGIKAEF